LNFVKAQTVPNLVIAPVGANGKVALYNGSAGTTQLIGDVSGYYRSTAVVAATPGPVTNLIAIPASTSIALSWTNPTSASLTGVMIRRAAGPTAPASATAGTLVADAAKPATSYTNTGLTAGTQYSYALFAHNGTPAYAAGAKVTSRTIAAGAGAVSGTVTDAGGTHHGLAGVTVDVWSESNGDSGSATTAADGTYFVTALSSATDYSVCFSDYQYAPGATGGSSDATGYIDQCWRNQPNTSSGTTPVTVTVGATTTGINASLAAGGAISGTVTDAGGTHHGLAEVSVHVYSAFFDGQGRIATTAANGAYVVTGLPAGTDYTVCFFTGGPVTGGTSDATGYVDQCWQNQPEWGIPTPLTVTTGMTRTGVSAALATYGAISGTVSDAGGTNQGLAGVVVLVQSLTTGVDPPPAVITAADGSYTVTGLLAAADYTVAFGASGATGGSSDAFGYFDQFYNNQPVFGTPTPVTVASGVTRTGINAAIVGAGAISGTVTDAGGAHHGLANVAVSIYSPSTGTIGGVFTAADGSWSDRRLEAATDYEVCFDASGATGGSSDVLGYTDQCYNSQPTSGTPTPVTVILGVTGTGINASLTPSGA